MPQAATRVKHSSVAPDVWDELAQLSKSGAPHRLRTMRMSQGLTMAELSKKIKVAISTLSKIESRHRNLTPDIACRVADALDLADPRELFSGSVADPVQHSTAVKVPIVEWSDILHVAMSGKPEGSHGIGWTSTGGVLAAFKLPEDVAKEHGMLALPDSEVPWVAVVNLSAREPKPGLDYLVSGTPPAFTIDTYGEDGWKSGIGEKAIVAGHVLGFACKRPSRVFKRKDAVAQVEAVEDIRDEES